MAVVLTRCASLVSPIRDRQIGRSLAAEPFALSRGSNDFTTTAGDRQEPIPRGQSRRSADSGRQCENPCKERDDREDCERPANGLSVPDGESSPVRLDGSRGSAPASTGERVPEVPRCGPRTRACDRLARGRGQRLGQVAGDQVARRGSGRPASQGRWWCWPRRRCRPTSCRRDGGRASRGGETEEIDPVAQGEIGGRVCDRVEVGRREAIERGKGLGRAVEAPLPVEGPALVDDRDDRRPGRGAQARPADGEP